MAVRVRTITRRQTWQGRLWDEITARVGSMAYAEAGKRDLRLDFLRGLAVTAMVVDHVGGDTFLTTLSGGNRAIVSAAEAFVFLSGLVLGMVYAERIARSGPGEAFKGMLHRAFTLYKASAGIALVFLGLFAFTDLRMWVDRASGIGVSDIGAAVLGALTLHYSFHGSDVLVMYTVMIAVGPLIMYLFHRGWTAQALAGSVALWAVYQRYPAEASMPWSVANSSFPIAAWQLLFVLGMAAGYHKAKVTGLLNRGAGSTVLAALGSGSLLYLLVRSDRAFGDAALPAWLFGDATYGSLFTKSELGPGRVIAFLALAVLVYTIVNALWVPLSRLLGWFIVPLGQNSLYVYIVHLFVIIVVYNLVPIAYEWAGAETWITTDNLNTAAQLITLGAAWIMVRTRFLFSFVPR